MTTNEDISNQTDDGTIDDFKEYRSIREEIWREHGQINSRMNWFLVFQTILISGVVFLLRHHFLKLIAIFISIAGFFLSLLAICSIKAAASKIREILRPKETQFKIINSEKENVDNQNSYPRWHVASSDRIDRNGMRFAIYAPIIVLCLWAAIFAVIIASFYGYGNKSPSEAYEIACRELNSIYGKNKWSRIFFEYAERDNMLTFRVKEVSNQKIITIKIELSSGQILELKPESY